VEFQSYRIPGWSFTPGIAIGVVHDTNVALTSPTAELGETEGDSLFSVMPSAQLEYLGRLTDFSANYRGFVRRYKEQRELDEFSQRANLGFTRAVNRRLSIFVRDAYADSPTTDDVELNGVPFRRTGSRSNVATAGANIRLTRFTRLHARYDTTWVKFDNPEETLILSGGWIHGLMGELERRISERLAVGAEYGVRISSVDSGERHFGFQDVGGVIRFQFGPHTAGNAAAGVSRLHDRNTGVTDTGPYVRAGITHTLDVATIGASFHRQFVPSFGFGGASSSHELGGHITMPLGRQRLYMHASGSWRHVKPFDDPGFEIDTISVRSILGYAVTRWARMEGVYLYTRQDSFVIVGGEVDRHRIGLQVVISQPVRIR
jgi:hypothetical protein